VKKQELMSFGIGNIFFLENYHYVYYLCRDWWSKSRKRSPLDISTKASILCLKIEHVRNKVTCVKPAFNISAFMNNAFQQWFKNIV